jgi:choline dehydrogenase
VLLDQPNVGRNLENHPGVNLQYAARREDSLVSQLGPVGQVRLGLEWMLARRGLGASNFFEAGAFLKTHDEADYANLQLEFLPLARRVVNGKVKVFPGFQLWMDLSRPRSRGHVRLRSADPREPPEIVFNHLAEEEDRKDMVRSVRLARELFAQPAWEGIRGEEVNPGAEARSDAEILAWARQSIGTSYHPSGTCRMAVSPEEGVVDASGRVHGLQGLRVVCAAIMPRVVTGNLSAPTYMIAEKIADDIRGRRPAA